MNHRVYEPRTPTPGVCATMAVATYVTVGLPAETAKHKAPGVPFAGTEIWLTARVLFMGFR